MAEQAALSQPSLEQPDNSHQRDKRRKTGHLPGKQGTVHPRGPADRALGLDLGQEEPGAAQQPGRTGFPPSLPVPSLPLPGKPGPSVGEGQSLRHVTAQAGCADPGGSKTFGKKWAVRGPGKEGTDSGHTWASGQGNRNAGSHPRRTSLVLCSARLPPAEPRRLQGGLGRKVQDSPCEW